MLGFLGWLFVVCLLFCFVGLLLCALADVFMFVLCFHGFEFVAWYLRDLCV